MEKMYGDHAELAKKAKLDRMPLLDVRPLKDTKLVYLTDPHLKKKMRQVRCFDRIRIMKLKRFWVHCGFPLAYRYLDS